ncbi:MAG: hypothetical protein JO142_00235 [Burkholderiales bacterium]|nr:hypothetical protein [Burkholderiales bacterium]
MKRTLTALLLATALMPAALAGGAATATMENAYQLQALQRTNPRHYAIITQMLSEIGAMPDASVSRWMQQSFGATDVLYGPAEPTNGPVRRRLAFSLDGARYDIIITLNSFESRKVLPSRF